MSENIKVGIKTETIEVWTGVEDGVDVDYSNLIAPFLYHRGSDMYANIELTSSFSIPDISSSYIINALVDFECVRDDVLDMMALIMGYTYSGEAIVKGRGGRLQATYSHLIQVKRAKIRMVNEIKKYINQGGIVDLQKFLSSEWSSLLTALSGILIENKAWRVGDWRLKYWYVAATSKRRVNIKIPKTITIKINNDNHVRFNLEKFEPVLTTNTGLRIKAKFLKLVSTCLGIPWGFQGMWEWLDLVDRLPIRDWAEEGQEPGERILKWFSILTTCITEAKKKIMIQNQTDVNRIANIIATRILQAAILVAMENKVWEKGLKEAGMHWSTEFVKVEMAYSLVAEPDGEIAWREWIDRTIKFLGYPSESGDKTFYCMLDIGHPLSHYKFLGMKDEEILESKSISMEKVNIAMYRFYDLKEGWYKQFGATIYRDGSIIPSEWKEHGVLMITEVDDWIKVFYRTGAFENPVLKISIVPVLDRHPISSWRSKMESIGIRGAYAGLGYKHAIKGRVLPIDIEEVEKREFVQEKDSIISKLLGGK